MEYISVKEFAKLHGVSERTIRTYCAAGRIEGAVREGKSWKVPADAVIKEKQVTDEVYVRSSAAEYLTYAAAVGDNPESVEMRYQDENIWLTQRMMAELYGVEVPTINIHISKIFEDRELVPEATIRNFQIVASEGNRQVSRDVMHYNLQMIIAVGFKINNERAVQFRKWANQIVKDYTIKGWAMDVERLKSGGSILTQDYFEKQLEKVREIRMSERRFYQKVTDIYATSIDYDPTSVATQRFYASVQNKMHYSVHGHTAAELIYERADATKEHMGLTSWDGAPNGKIHKYDVTVGKNYLTHDELQILERLVSSYLDFAEMQAMRKVPMTMADWETRLNSFLTLWDREVLKDSGRISAEMAKLKAETEFEKFRVVQDRLFQSDFDKFILLENEVK